MNTDVSNVTCSMDKHTTAKLARMGTTALVQYATKIHTSCDSRELIEVLCERIGKVEQAAKSYPNHKELYDALAALVELYNYKVTFGKDAYYINERVKLWNNAKEVLNNAQL